MFTEIIFSDQSYTHWTDLNLAAKNSSRKGRVEGMMDGWKERNTSLEKEVSLHLLICFYCPSVK